MAQKMTGSENIQVAKSCLEDYLNMITEKKGKSYICPICGSGTGKNKTPAGHFNQDDMTYHCFSCGFHGDIFNLVEKIEGITNKADIFKRIYEIFNIQARQTEKSFFSGKIHKIHSNKQTESLPLVDYTEYYKACHARASETDYFSFRRLSQKIIERFNLGFDPSWRSPKALREGKNPPASSRIIIPTSKYSYVARATDHNAKQYKIVKEGISELFNRKSLSGIEPVFIVEGEIDALSIIEAGGQAVALGSISNKNKFLSFLGEKKPKALLILSLDNDEAGRKAQAEIADALSLLKTPFLEANISGGYKDPNEHLLNAPDAFKSIICDTVACALRYAEKMTKTRKAEMELEREKYINMNNIRAYKSVFQDGIKASASTPEILTGFAELDKVLDVGLYEGLYVLGAISSLGKTSFALQIADQIAQQGQDVLFFSLEMGKFELVSKSISRLTFLKSVGNSGNAKTARGIMSAKRHISYNQTELELINASMDKYFSDIGNHLYINEGIGDIGVFEVKEAVEQHIKMTENKPVVMIDYLQILSPADMRASDKQNTDKAVFELKRLSRSYKIPVIGISSFNRENYSSEVNMSSYKESGAIEYSSDVLLGLQLVGAGRKDFDVNAEKQKNPRQIELKILKNRNGATGDSLTFDYYPMFNYFKEIGKKIIGNAAKGNGKRI